MAIRQHFQQAAAEVLAISSLVELEVEVEVEVKVKVGVMQLKINR